MRTFLIAAVMIVCWSAGDARACPAPRPTAARLTLVSATDAPVAADGGLLIERAFVSSADFGADETWALQTPDGQPVAVEVVQLGSDLERWRIVDDRERDLQLVDGAGKVVQALHQRRGGGGRLAGPKVRRMTSTTARGGRLPSNAIAGAEVKLILAGPAPAGAVFIAIATAGRDSTPLVVLPVTAGQRAFELMSYTRKGCSDGPPTLFIGDRLLLTWLDGGGRQSRATTVKVTRGVPSPPEP